MHQQNRDPGSSWLGDLSQSRPGLSCSYCTAASSNPHPSCRAPGPSSWPPAVLPCSSSEQHTPWVAAAAAACSFLNSDECLATNHVSLVTTPMGLHRQQVEMPVLYWNVERRSTIHRNTQVHACTGVYRRVPACSRVHARVPAVEQGPLVGCTGFTMAIRTMADL